MKIADDKSDALKLIQKIHREMFEVNRDLAELEYLLYSMDERCKIEFFGRGSNDERGSKEGTKAN